MCTTDHVRQDNPSSLEFMKNVIAGIEFCDYYTGGRIITMLVPHGQCGRLYDLADIACTTQTVGLIVLQTASPL
jgi:hypothetical protein